MQFAGSNAVCRVKCSLPDQIQFAGSNTVCLAKYVRALRRCKTTYTIWKTVEIRNQAHPKYIKDMLLKRTDSTTSKNVWRQINDFCKFSDALKLLPKIFKKFQDISKTLQNGSRRLELHKHTMYKELKCSLPRQMQFARSNAVCQVKCSLPGQMQFAWSTCSSPGKLRTYRGLISALLHL